jgi:hypothetical protein
MPLNEAHGLPEPEPTIANSINHTTSSEEFANLAMEEDISMSFLLDNFDVYSDLGDSGVLHDQTRVSNTQPTRHPRAVSAKLQGAPPTQTIHKPYVSMMS